jgi:hypothetical protein
MHFVLRRSSELHKNMYELSFFKGICMVRGGWGGPQGHEELNYIFSYFLFFYLFTFYLFLLLTCYGVVTFFNF